MTGWMIALGVLTLLWVLPLGVSAVYDRKGGRVWVLIGPVKIPILPQSSRKKEATQSTPSSQHGSKPSPKPESQQTHSGGSIAQFRPWLDLGGELLGDLRRKLRVNRMELELTMAGDDPCDLAVNYGRANAALAVLVEQLEGWFIIRRKRIQVDCDFAGEETVIYARLDLTLSLGRLIGLAVRYGIRGLNIYQSMEKKGKGGGDL